MANVDMDLSARRSRGDLLRHGLRLEYLTVGWNLVEGLVAIAAAVTASSVALLGFGIDSFVESASGGVMIWRLIAEQRAVEVEAVEALERRAQRLVGLSLFLLAAYITFDAVTTLASGERPQPSGVGIALAALSLAVMWRLARSKRRAAVALGSRAFEADAFQTTACFWLSLIVLVGVGANALLGWWWADPLAALGMTYFLVAEGREAWKG
jgi:divalent metal cation (Fe/Co/Zn/Cd) transporter